MASLPTLTPLSLSARFSPQYEFDPLTQMNPNQLMKELVKMHAILKQIEYWIAIFEVQGPGRLSAPPLLHSRSQIFSTPSITT